MSDNQSQLSVHFRFKDPMPEGWRVIWLEDMVGGLTRRMVDKFRRGMVEHRCEFGEQDIYYLLNAIEEEAIDTLFYVNELKRRIKERKII